MSIPLILGSFKLNSENMVLMKREVAEVRGPWRKDACCVSPN